MEIPPLTPGELDPAELPRLLDTDAAVILEIGANDGADTLRLLQAFPHAKIYAFEPDPRAIAKFRKQVVDPRVQLFELAIGAADGTAEFHVSSGLPEAMLPHNKARYPEGWDQSGSLKEPRAHKIVWPWVKFESRISVQVRGLDSWAREHGIGSVDLIWADTQGAEADLIAGGAETLARARFLFTEYYDIEMYAGQPALPQILDMLPRFQILRLYQQEVLLRNTAIVR